MPTITKLSIVKNHLANGRIRDALRLAKSFARLGEHATAITRAWDALQRPDFYRELGMDPDQLVADGVAAMRARWDIN
jgi:hypothetical protein